MFINTKIMRNSCCLMNKILCVITLVMFMISCNDVEEKDVVKSYYENGVIKSELRYKDGKLNGECVWYYPNGKTEMKTNYRMDTLVGETIRWYENGNLESKYFLKNDQYEGAFEKYNVFGDLVKLEHYKDGVLHGEMKQWYDSGSLFVEGAYKEGMFDGKWIIYYENGSVGSMATYKDGAGVQIGYSYDGLMLTKIHYRDNVKHGEEIRYDRKGDVAEILIWENGEYVKTMGKQ